MLDYTALTSPARPEDVRDFAQWAHGPGRHWDALPPVVPRRTSMIIVVLSFIVFPVAVAVTIFFGNEPDPIVLLMVLVFVVVAVFAIRTISRSRFAGLGWEAMYRLHRFAENNGFGYLGTGDTRKGYPGHLFAAETSVFNCVYSTSGPYFEIGNARRLSGSENDQPIFENRGYLAVRLDKPLPQITLEATANRNLLSYPVAGTGQQVHLEGDFDDHFTLRCPQGYERDALYILSPDLMALLIDETSAFDVELIDEWMFAYSPKPFVEPDPALYERLFRIIDTVGAKAASRSAHYSDARQPPSGAKGARFVRGIPVWAVVIGAVAVAIILLSFFGGMVVSSSFHISIS